MVVLKVMYKLIITLPRDTYGTWNEEKSCELFATIIIFLKVTCVSKKLFTSFSKCMNCPYMSIGDSSIVEYSRIIKEYFII